MAKDSQFYLGVSQKTISFEVVVACIAHIFFFVLLILLDKIPHFSLLSQNEIEVPAIVRSAVRVDVVAMPKHTLRELKAIKSTSVEQSDEDTSATIKKVESAKAKTEESGKQLSDFLKKYSQKKIKNKDLTEGSRAGEKKLDAKSVSQLKSLVLEGNKLSAGGDLTGDVISSELTKYEAYTQSLPEHVRRFWKLPSYLREKELSCKIRIFLSGSGKLIKYDLYQSSGVREYDQSAIRAVENADPYPRPSKEIARYLAAGRIILSFPL